MAGKPLLSAFTVGLVALIGVLVVRTLWYVPAARHLDDAAVAPAIQIDSNQVAEHLRQAIQFKTVSFENTDQIDYQAFNAFREWLRQAFPLAHKQLLFKTFNEHTLLFKWPGSVTDQTMLISAHYDVVPAPNASDWQVPPFSGERLDGYIYGRGTLDNKGAAIALMQALELNLAAGLTPKHTVYIALTHDEEIGSDHGANSIRQYLADSNTKIDWSIDEGSFVLDGIIPGIEYPVAAINIAEKGYLNLELTARAEPGHSSMPPLETAVDILAKALVNLRHSPLESGLNGVSETMLKQLTPYMPFTRQLLFANQWLFGSLIEGKLAEKASGRAMMGTTMAPTMLSGSIKPNVLPMHASAVINFRLHPRDSVESIVAHVEAAIADKRVSIDVSRAMDASNVADHNHEGFNIIADAAQRVFNGSVVTAGLTIGATDSRFYDDVVGNSYRFNPAMITNQDLSGFHGLNERLSETNLTKAVQFYADIMMR